MQTIITPQNTDLHFSTPKNFVGKKIKVSYELAEEDLPKANTMAAYKGILTSDEAEQLQEYVKKSREEWDRHF